MGRKMKVVDSNKKHLTKAEKEMRKEVEELASDGLPMLPTKPPNTSISKQHQTHQYPNNTKHINIQTRITDSL